MLLSPVTPHVPRSSSVAPGARAPSLVTPPPGLVSAACQPKLVQPNSTPGLTWPCTDTAHLCAPPQTGGCYGGAQWVEHTRFRNQSGKEAISLILAHIRAQAGLAAKGLGKRPVVVVDLDYTLYNNDPRMLAVLVGWANSPAAHAFPAQRRAILNGLKAQYDIADTLRTGGLNNAQIAAVKPSILAYFRETFFDDVHTMLDTPYPWMAKLLRAFQEAGAIIVFLTGREEERQGQGTRCALARDGFTVDNERVFLMLKPAARGADGKPINDQQFKTESAKPIAAIGEVVATLDNEPANALVFSTLYPKAANVFVDTRYSDQLVPVGDGLIRIGEDAVTEALPAKPLCGRYLRRAAARTTPVGVWSEQLIRRPAARPFR